MRPADLLPLIYEPERLVAAIHPGRGLRVARSLSCEREDTVEQFVHVCADAASAALEPMLSGVQQQVVAAIELPEEGGIDCQPTAGGALCALAPHNECEPTYRLWFEEGYLRAIAERDDWQLPDPKLDQRIEELLAREADCPGH